MGWEYYDRVQEIMPNATARGLHAFSPATADVPALPKDDEMEADADNREDKGHDDHLKMDVDKVDSSLAELSSKAGMKRKLASIEGSSLQSSGSPLNSTKPSTPSLPSSRPSKKTTAQASSSSAVTSSLSAAAATISSTKRLQKITPAVAITGMQGTLNRLTDVFAESLIPKAVPTQQTVNTETRSKALHLLQTRDDGLSQQQKVEIVTIFMKNPDAMATYLDLEDETIRTGWMLG
jgi:hypothetical protein